MNRPHATPSKVLYATFETLPAPTGSACWSAEIIRELAQYFDLDVLSLKSEDLSHIERYHGARLLRVPVAEGPFLDQVKAFQRALNRQLDSEEYTACQFTSIWEGMLLAARRQAQKYRLIYEVGSLPSLDFRDSHPDQARQVETSYSLKQQEERCFDMADRLLVPTPQLREHLVRRGVPARKISLVPPAIDLEPFEGAAQITRQAGTILYLGNLRPWQGVPSVLHALAELPRHMRVKLLLIVPRDDPGFGELLAKVQMLGLTRNVEIVEPVPMDRLAEIVSQASICVAPLANHEHNREAASIPHKVLTYMACARPVVAAQQPGLKGLLEHNRTGLLYRPGDTLGLVDSLKRLLLDHDLAIELGNRARLFLEEHHTLSGSMEDLRDVYRDLLGAPTGLIPNRRADSTQPSLVAPDPAGAFQADPETKPVPVEALSGTVGKFGADTAPVTLDAAAVPADTDPRQATIDEPELVFTAIADEDTDPHHTPSDADQWQVVDSGEIQFEPSPAKLSDRPPDEKRTTHRRKRYLLGGPSYPIEDSADAPAGSNPEQATEPGGAALGAPEDLQEVDDSDIVPLDGEEIESTRRRDHAKQSHDT